MSVTYCIFKEVSKSKFLSFKKMEEIEGLKVLAVIHGIGTIHYNGTPDFEEPGLNPIVITSIPEKSIEDTGTD